MDRDTLTGLLKDWGIALAVALVALVLWQAAMPSPRTEGLAPSLVLPSTAGGSVDLAETEHEVTLVNFWATWCAPCRKEIPVLSRFADAHDEVGIYGVSVDDDMSTARLDQASKRLGIRYPVLHDVRGTAAQRWGVTVFPTTFVLDADHQILSVAVGELDEVRLARLVDEAQR